MSKQVALDLIALGLHELVRYGELRPSKETAEMIVKLENPLLIDNQHPEARSILKDAIDWHFKRNIRVISCQVNTDGASEWYAEHHYSDAGSTHNPLATLGPFETPWAAVWACYSETLNREDHMSCEYAP